MMRCHSNQQLESYINYWINLRLIYSTKSENSHLISSVEQLSKHDRRAKTAYKTIQKFLLIFLSFWFPKVNLD